MGKFKTVQVKKSNICKNYDETFGICNKLDDECPCEGEDSACDNYETESMEG